VQAIVHAQAMATHPSVVRRSSSSSGGGGGGGGSGGDDDDAPRPMPTATAPRVLERPATERGGRTERTCDGRSFRLTLAPCGEPARAVSRRATHASRGRAGGALHAGGQRPTSTIPAHMATPPTHPPSERRRTRRPAARGRAPRRRRRAPRPRTRAPLPTRLRRRGRRLDPPPPRTRTPPVPAPTPAPSARRADIDARALRAGAGAARAADAAGPTARVEVPPVDAARRGARGDGGRAEAARHRLARLT